MARIIAHFMREEEFEAARQAMTNVQETDSFLLGECDEGEIPGLREQGLIVERVEEEPETRAETPGTVSPSRMIASFEEDVVGGGGYGPEFFGELPEPDLAGPNFYLIGLRGPLLEDWRRAFDELKVELLERVPPNSYTARLTPEQVYEVNDLPFVSGLRLYGPEDARPAEMLRAAPAPAPGVDRVMLVYDARLHREEDLERVLGWFEERGVSVAGASGRKVRFYLLEESPLADEIAALPEIAEMEPYVRPGLHNDAARVLLGIDGPATSSVTDNLSQTGDGQVVAVADTGLDDAHPDFQGRIAGVVALGRPGDHSDPHGHGTHVAGSVLGDGAASGGQIRGAAPEAELFFQSLLDASGGLGGLPMNLGELFEEAYKAGARIHNNSWGAATNSVYTFNSIEVDEFVAQHRDMLIVISAGNEGQAANRMHSAQGFVDWLSLGSPATSKNALTVGASRTNRTAGGLSASTYGRVWPAQFPDPPISDAKVSGDTECLSAFSSRGPCDDHRIKPEVVAPGTDIASAKSSRAPLRNFWGAYPNDGRYAYMGGTSMSAPLVSGCAALVREYYIKDRGHQPSAALLKATLINGTRWLSGSDSVADHANLPNFHQGFGCVYMPWTIPNSSFPNLRLEYLDPWQDAQRQFVRTGQRFRFRFRVSGGDWLRICLAWTDLPMRALQNNLDLTVMHIQSGQKWMGNKDLPLRLTRLDTQNNVELVRLEPPPPGDYLLQVSASNLLSGPQDYVLVVAGELASPLMRT